MSRRMASKLLPDTAVMAPDLLFQLGEFSSQFLVAGDNLAAD